MKAMAKTLPNDTAVQDLVTYIAELKRPVGTAAKHELSTVAAYQTCAGCHGRQAEGNAASGAPRLAGQNVAYLIRQVEAFRVGRRGAAPGDAPGGQMAAIARAVPEKTLRQAVAQLGPPAQRVAASKGR
jgi:cytochrome c553